MISNNKNNENHAEVITVRCPRSKFTLCLCHLMESSSLLINHVEVHLVSDQTVLSTSAVGLDRKRCSCSCDSTFRIISMQLEQTRAHISPPVEYMWNSHSQRAFGAYLSTQSNARNLRQSWQPGARRGLRRRWQLERWRFLTRIYLTRSVTLEISDTFLAAPRPNRARTTWCILIWHHKSLQEAQGGGGWRGWSWQTAGSVSVTACLAFLEFTQTAVNT